MATPSPNDIETRVRDALTAWKKLDAVDVKILEGLTVLGPRNLALIANHLQLPTTTVRFRVNRMLEDSFLFLHLNPYHTNMGLKKAVVFVEAAPGYETDLLDCLRVNDFWLFLCRIYGPYEGCGGIWAIPQDRTEEFHSFLKGLLDAEVARNVEINWSTCFHDVSVSSRWFNIEEEAWAFNWDEWIAEVETIEGEMPYTLTEPKEWPIKVDYVDLMIIKELEKDGRASMPEISREIGIPLSKIKYHYHEHVLKHDLIEGYQVEIYRFPFPVSEILFFKFEFENYSKMAKFALSLFDKPFVIHLGKVLGENALVSHIFLPKWEFRRFVETLSILIRRDLLKSYNYVIQDMFQTWRETIPYEHFNNGRWFYNHEKQLKELKKVIARARRKMPSQ